MCIFFGSRKPRTRKIPETRKGRKLSNQDWPISLSKEGQENGASINNQSSTAYLLRKPIGVNFEVTTASGNYDEGELQLASKLDNLSSSSNANSFSSKFLLSGLADIPAWVT